MEEIGKNGRMLFNLAKKLRNSQGFYARLYNKLVGLSAEDWENLEEELPDFNDDIDVIMYLEG